MAKSVFTRAFPRAGTTVGTAAHKSYPADKGLPRVGMMAFSESRLIFNTSFGELMADIARRTGNLSNVLRRILGIKYMQVKCVFLT